MFFMLKKVWEFVSYQIDIITRYWLSILYMQGWGLQGQQSWYITTLISDLPLDIPAHPES